MESLEISSDKKENDLKTDEAIEANEYEKIALLILSFVIYNAFYSIEIDTNT